MSQANAVPPDPRLDAATRARIVRLADDPAALAARLQAIEDEWDIERVLEANALAMSLVGSGISILRRRRLLALNLPLTVAAFVLQHAVRGARPPLGLLRRWGFRTAAEIEAERLALLALKGDLPGAGQKSRAGLVRAIARRGRRALGR